MGQRNQTTQKLTGSYSYAFRKNLSRTKMVSTKMKTDSTTEQYEKKKLYVQPSVRMRSIFTRRWRENGENVENDDTDFVLQGGRR